MIWEVIETNKRRSWTLFIGMAVALLGSGYLIGYASAGPDAAYAGLLMAGVLWAILSFVSVFFGDQILLSSSGAREISPQVHPKLFNVTEEMTIASGMGRMPKLYVIDDPSPNAFATGIHRENASITVTLGLLTRLNRDELQAVIAHEMSHILNRDVLFVTLAGTMLGSIQLLSEVFLRGIFHGSDASKRFRSRDSSKGGGAMALLALAVAILAPILIQIFYFSISRKREYLADACAARLTRYPEGLASALEKISGAGFPAKDINPVTAAMFIYNPLSRQGLATLMSTHPPAADRINVLRAMSGGAGFKVYEEAFKKLHGKASLLPSSAIGESQDVQMRPASTDKDDALPGDSRGIADLQRATHGFAFFPCQCGLRIKVPPEFDRKKINCPRCGFIIDVPFFGKIGKTTVSSSVSGSPQVYTRRGKGWESFFCGCGRVVQLSPAFSAPTIECVACHKEIRIV